MEERREDARAVQVHEAVGSTARIEGSGRDDAKSPGGRAPSEEGEKGAAEGGQPPGRSGADPVFVDASGRRSKKVRRIGWGVAVLCAAYAVTLAVALVGGGSAAPLLDIPGVAGLAQRGKPARTVRPAPGPSASGPSGRRQTGPGTVPSLTDGGGDAVSDADPRAARAAAERPGTAGPAPSATTRPGGRAAATSGEGGGAATGGSGIPRSGGGGGTTGATGASGATGATGAVTGGPPSGGTSTASGGTGTAAGVSGTTGTGGATAGTGGDGGPTGTPGDPGGTTTGASGDPAGSTASASTGTTGDQSPQSDQGAQSAPDAGSRAGQSPAGENSAGPAGGAPAGELPGRAAPSEGVVRA